MKTATIPSLRVEQSLRDDAERVLQDGESLSSFVEQSIRESILRRRAQKEFVARGLKSSEEARRSGKYVAADAVLDRLEKMLNRAKRSEKASR